MPFAAAATVISGKPYLVLLVAGSAPSSLADFIDAEDFTLDMEGASYRVRGSGRRVDNEVRYHEKDIDNNGRDIRVWRVVRHEDGNFLADHAAAF